VPSFTFEKIRVRAATDSCKKFMRISLSLRPRDRYD
jgi:hypothetical protein